MKKVRTLIRKEILDILRDKKTLVMMVVVPVLLYPLILIGMTLIFSTIMQSESEDSHVVGYGVQSEALVQDLQRIYEENQEELDAKLEFCLAQPGEEAQVRQETDVWLETGPGTNMDVASASKESAADIDADRDGLEADADKMEGVSDTGSADRENSSINNTEAAAGAVTDWHVTIEYTSSEQSSQYTQEALEELLELYREELVEVRLQEQGLDESFLHPVIYESVDAASISENMGMDIGGSIGMMLSITILLGAVYPAIDATAGEKERGTLETLLTLPVTNFQMILSKYISVALFASVTAILSVLSLGGSVVFLMYGLSPEIAASMPGISLTAVVSAIPILLLTLVVTALLAAALCMTFCVFAKSFKEANNYVTPVLLVVMFASMAGMVPSVKLNYTTAMIPIVNVSLMVKQIVSQQFDFVLAGITIGVNLGCSILIIWILGKMYDSENILFADGFRSFRIFQKRSDIAPGTVPQNGDLVVGVTALFLLLLYVGTAASLRLGFWGTAVSQLLILIVPLAVLWYMKSDRRKLLSLRCPRLRPLAGSIFLYLGTCCLVLALSVALTSLLPGSAENVEVTFNAMAEEPVWAILLVLALMPAVGEEILFRGFLFGSLRENLGKRRAGLAILLSALVFGAFHMSLVKLLPTAILGASFAYIVYAGGSIYVTMFLHFFNNAVSMLLLKYPEQAGRLVPILMKETLTLPELLGLTAAGVALAGAGVVILQHTSSTDRNER